MADLPAARRQAILDAPYHPPPGDPVAVHVDDAILVLDKPAGLLCAPGLGEDKQDCLVARAQARWPGALLVHRLDLATSGLVVLARTREAHAALSAAFRDRRVEKAYEALVYGPLPSQAGDIDLPLAADWPNRPRQKVCHETGKASHTRWRRLAGGPAELGRAAGTATTAAMPTAMDTVGGMPLVWEHVWLQPLTGRSHQLRVHLAAIGCPIVGDALYGRAVEDAPRLMLHATRLAFRHPVSGEAVSCDSAVPFAAQLASQKNTAAIRRSASASPPK